jgi:ABC-2 type transport system permease protein
MKIFRSNLNGKALATFTALALCFAGMGSYIFYNENVLNKYETNADQEKNSVQYEKDYKKYERAAQPRITDTKVQVDIYPEEREVYVLRNLFTEELTDSVITNIHVSYVKI